MSNVQNSLPERFKAGNKRRSAVDCGHQPIHQMLEWKENYETGVLQIDTQHKVLFNNINRLEDLLSSRDIDPAEADYLLGFLEQYAEQHFETEETCMVRHRCPAYGKNKEGHAQFRSALGHFKNEYTALGPTRELVQRLHETLVFWINSHILQIDMQLRTSVKKQQDS
jgi:hemerythrin